MPTMTPTATPAATPAVTAMPTDTTTPTTPVPTPTFTAVQPPATGLGSMQGSNDSLSWLPIALGTAALALSIGGGLLLLRRRP